MEDCCDNKNVIFTDYYVCINIFTKIPFMKMKIIYIKNLFQNHFIKG